MDVFRMLTRSTTLAKTASGPKNVPRMPSSGEAQNPQLFGQFDSNPVVSEERSLQLPNKKRKHDRISSLEPSQPLPELDFSGETHKTVEETLIKSTSTHSDDASGLYQSSEVEKKVDVESPEPELLDEEACKRVLKAHKLKITLLRDSNQNIKPVTPQITEDGSKKRKRKPNSNVTTNVKIPNIQLFPQPLSEFSQLQNRYGISRRLVNNILSQGYTIPTEVQLGSLPLLLGSESDAGLGSRPKGNKGQRRREENPPHVDLLTVAPTGSGKTLAFLIPILNSLLQARHKDRQDNTDEKHAPMISPQAPLAVIIAPTKELAAQIVNEGRKLALGTGVKVSGMRKGMRVESQPEAGNVVSVNDQESAESDLEHEHSEDEGAAPDQSQVTKADILVSTPLTLLNYLTGNGTHSQRLLPLVRFLVLDEADVLLDPLFRTQTLGIWHACIHPQLRVSLWSATMGSNIEQLAQSTLHDRQNRLSTPDSHPTPKLIRLVVGLKDSAIPNISHKLVYAATESGKLLALRQLLHSTATAADSGPSLRPPFLIFTQTIPRAVALHSELIFDITPEAGGSSRIAVLHSDLSDTTRYGIMTRFRKGEVWILITTDLLARGVDFRGINGVVNYDVPNSGAAYIHRVGRTGRAGREGGIAVTFYTTEDIPYVKNVANIIAASERQRNAEGAGGNEVKQWLLDALPKPSKTDKKELKRHGIKARRAGPASKGKSKMRISTKSGFDRKLEHNRQGALRSSRKRQANGDQSVGDSLRVDPTDVVNGSDWSGIDD